MIPSEFGYERPSSVEEAVSMLREHGEDAKALAGGHSLIPLMKLRLAAPTVLVDLRHIDGLSGISKENGSFRIGAMTPHARLQESSELGVASAAAAKIGDQQVRNQGTIGGSLAHGDPAADLPAVVLACEATVAVTGSGGSREVAAADLFEDFLTTSLAPDELITEVRLPWMHGYGYGYEKFVRRSEDWPMVGVCALVKASGDTCEDVRIGLTHMATTPLRATQAEEALRGQPLDAERIAQAAGLAAEGTDPPADLNASADYKRHLAQVLCRRALEAAAGG